TLLTQTLLTIVIGAIQLGPEMVALTEPLDGERRSQKLLSAIPPSFPAGQVQRRSSDSDEEGGASGQTEMEFLRNLFSRTLGFGSEKPEKVLEELTLEGVTNFILTEKCKAIGTAVDKGYLPRAIQRCLVRLLAEGFEPQPLKFWGLSPQLPWLQWLDAYAARKNIVCMVGAGISTSAGIPDCRSPGRGLYANVQQFNLPYPEAIFEIDYFKQNPEPFFTLAREIYPGHIKPTVCHYFIRLLKDKGLLLRCYTQNVDALERVAGLDPEHLVEAHGTFYTFHCISSTCKKPYSLEWMKEKVFTSLIPRCEKCQNIVKPDIVFFGEFLPPHFFSLMQSDSQNADLLIIMGTSLQVQPFSSLVSRVPANTPRLLINKEKTGESDPFMSLMGLGCGMDFDSEKAYRQVHCGWAGAENLRHPLTHGECRVDVAWLGDCDEGCLALAELLGWKEELEELVKNEHAVIEAKSGQTVGVGAGADRQPAKKQEQNPSLEKEKPPANKEE
ncbi:hypothetical protein Chor_001910, partial [Crotalus horridus]